MADVQFILFFKFSYSMGRKWTYKRFKVLNCPVFIYTQTFIDLAWVCEETQRMRIFFINKQEFVLCSLSKVYNLICLECFNVKIGYFRKNVAIILLTANLQYYFICFIKFFNDLSATMQLDCYLSLCTFILYILIDYFDLFLVVCSVSDYLQKYKVIHLLKAILTFSCCEIYRKSMVFRP